MRPRASLALHRSVEFVSDRNPVGVIGIGLLGQAFVQRLRGAGFEIMGFDVDAAKNAKLVELGGRPTASVADLARGCDPIVLAVFSTDQVEDVVERELLPALGNGSGKVVLCASTCDPDRLAALGERVATRGLRLLETPVSGASGQVSRGEGVGLIGGEGDVVGAVEPILRALFASYFHIGKIGNAGRAKLAVNLILGLNRLALAEGLVFAERLGLDPEAFLKVARRSAASSQVMDIKGSKMVRGEFAAEGRITQHLKDVHLMLEQAERVRQRLPLLEIHADVLDACVRQGEGDLDNSAVIKEIRRRTGS
jgi:3-hydroxyisobutyrate dehydrogenase-like beta-hydroxyacid dehydrogenase